LYSDGGRRNQTVRVVWGYVVEEDVRSFDHRMHRFGVKGAREGNWQT